MNKLVYLFELDSVRNTKKEIECAQEALFDELVKNGNYVACTFNQLVDSKGFLAVIHDEIAYNNILKLIQFGVIRISRYGTIRTASQYVQNLDKKFIFSSLPEIDSLPQTDPEQSWRDKMTQALINSDLSILEDEREHLKTEDDQQKLTAVIRFVNLVLSLSVKGLTINKPKEKRKTLDEFLNDVQKINDLTITEKNKKIFHSSIDLLNEVRKSINDLNKRSDWVTKLNENEEADNTEVIKIAKFIIDLCYNYALEDSILGVSKHYKDFGDDDHSFQKDFDNRLKLYIDSLYQNREDSDNAVKLPKWDIAVRILDPDTNKQATSFKGDNRWTFIKRKVNELLAPFKTKNLHESSNFTSQYYYVEDVKNEQKAWSNLIAINIVKRLGAASIGIILFLLVDQGLDKVKGYMPLSDWAKESIAWTILNVIIFAIVSAKLSSVFNIPDIMESFKKIWSSFCDGWYIHKNKNDAYYRFKK
ncbi:hypothetical protein [Sulfuricurvum sp.]|uniref:hypothetical protein n=1 Tax=Sulfuricurvum sp. TaxID=2025608 RepID=UPI002D457153|nr:hypothetical protein [Sulfuricurvum sp.]HZF70418.1 hypothetical protein [Sulfuricurvum sp.]